MHTFNLTFRSNSNLTLKEIQELLDKHPKTNLNISNFEKVESYPDNFYYKKYGKGFLLFVNNDSKLFGQKYFLNGCWVSKVNGWFFKNDKTPINLNAELVNKKVVWSDYIIDEENDMSVEHHSDDHSVVHHSDNHSVEHHSDDHSVEHHSDDHSVEHHSDDHSVEHHSYEDLDDLNYIPNIDRSVNCYLNISGNRLIKYGKGYLLYPKGGDNHDIKYLYNGWWIPSVGGWFFKKENLDNLLMKGVFLK